MKTQQLEELEKTAKWLQEQIDELKKLNEKPDLSAEAFWTRYIDGLPDMFTKNEHAYMIDYAEKYYNWRKEQES